MSKQQEPQKGTPIFPILKSYEFIEVDLKHLTGQILTIIDGAISNEKQNKAIKDQIKEKVSSLLRLYQRHCSEDTSGHSVNL